MVTVMTLTPEQIRRRRGERGNVMIMTAILAVGLVLAVGLCIDGARIYMTRAELQNAADAAALSAARELNGGTGGLNDAVTAAQAAALQANKYGLNRTGGNAPAVTISTVEFAASLNGPWYAGAGGVPAGTESTISYVRVTTQTANTPVLFAVRALGNSHAESRSATAGYSAPINTICDFFPIAVALDPAVEPGDDPLTGYPTPNTTMSLTFVQGTGNSATLVNKNYIILEVPDISGNGAPETLQLVAGLTSICKTLNTSINFHMTPQANQNNGPKEMAFGANTRFNEYTNQFGGVDPATFPPDSNIMQSISFSQYDNRTAVTTPNPNAPGQDMRRVLIVPIVWPGTYDPPNAIVRKWAAFFLKDKAVVTNPCSKSTAQCSELHVEWIDEKLILGRGGFDPAGGCTTFSVPVLYQ